MNAPDEPTTARRPRILLVEDDPAYAERLRRNLAPSGFEPHVVGDVDAARARLAEHAFDLVLTDIRLPGASGLELVAALSEQTLELAGNPPPVVVLTSINSVETAVDAMRRGAVDYLTKEATREEIVLRLRNVLDRGELARENRDLRHTLTRYQEFSDIIGASAAIERLKQQIAEIAPSDVTVLITGPTGVGKELVARALHKASPRARGPFVEVNCAALPEENMFLSELFGHERGAFTGAVGRKRGQFELADGGTLFFDEVGELPTPAQPRVLRAIETQQFTRLGGERPIRTNCRLVFATNRDLGTEVAAGGFREDLYYRINVFPIEVPPLRTRTEDVAPLVRFFAARLAEQHRLAPVSFDDDALAALRTNAWPGNVRELRNVVERLSIRFAGRTVSAADLAALNFGGQSAGPILLPEGGVKLEEVERSLVEQALQRSDWNQRRAAKLLGISVDRMNARVKKFGLSHPSWRVHTGES